MDEPEAQQAATAETAGQEPPPAVPADRLSRLLTRCGLALAVIATLEFIGIVSQGVALKQASLGPIYRVGYAFLTNLDTVPLGLIMLVAVVLVVLPTVAARPTSEADDRQAAFTLGLTASFALLTVIGAVLAVFARVRVDHLRSAAITGLTDRVLASYVIRDLGPALVAFVAAIAALRTRFATPDNHLPVTPDP